MNSIPPAEYPCAALDMSGPFASFHVSNSPTYSLIDISQRLAPREGQAFINRLLSALNSSALPLSNIKTWIVGVGPGTFGGVRSAVAFASGVATASNARLLSMPSFIPWCRAALPNGIGRSAVVERLHDGSCLLCHASFDSNGIMDSQGPVEATVTSISDNAHSFNAMTLLGEWPHIPLAPDSCRILIPDAFPVGQLLDPACRNALSEAIPSPLYWRPPAIRPHFFMRTDI